MNIYHTQNIYMILEDDEEEANSNINQFYQPKLEEKIIINEPLIEDSNQISSEQEYQNEDSEEEESTTNPNGEYKKYVEPKILDNVIWQYYFCKEDIDRVRENNKSLKMTDKGLYSISKPEDAKWIGDIIKKFIYDQEGKPSTNFTIMDATAGMGGNTISFSKFFEKVISIEINQIHFQVLKNNIDAIGCNNVDLRLDNFVHTLMKFPKLCDVVFIDPPWGGRGYKNFRYFSLKLGKTPIQYTINLIHSLKYPYVVLKAPYNLNISNILTDVNYKNIQIFKNKNMILCIFYGLSEDI